MTQPGLDVILSDFSIPSYSGATALAMARKALPNVPFLFVSGTIGEERAVESLKSGATDFVLKQHLNRLPGAINRALREARQITDRARAIEALREGEQRYRALVDNAPTGIFINVADNFVYVNEAFCRILGAQRPEQLLGTSILDRCHPDFCEGIRNRIERMRTTGQAVPLVDQRYICLDGSFVDVETAAAPITFQGQPAIQAVVNDITRRRKVEDALRASEERFRQLAENIEEVFWLTDPKKNVMLYISPGYEQIWGHTCQSLYDSPQSWLDAIHPGDRERVLHAVQTRQAKGGYDEEYRIVRLDGQVRTIRDRALFMTPLGKFTVSLALPGQASADHDFREPGQRLFEMAEGQFDFDFHRCKSRNRPAERWARLAGRRNNGGWSGTKHPGAQRPGRSFIIKGSIRGPDRFEKAVITRWSCLWKAGA